MHLTYFSHSDVDDLSKVSLRMCFQTNLLYALFLFFFSQGCWLWATFLGDPWTRMRVKVMVIRRTTFMLSRVRDRMKVLDHFNTLLLKNNIQHQEVIGQMLHVKWIPTKCKMKVSGKLSIVTLAWFF